MRMRWATATNQTFWIRMRPEPFSRYASTRSGGVPASAQRPRGCPRCRPSCRACRPATSACHPGVIARPLPYQPGRGARGGRLAARRDVPPEKEVSCGGPFPVAVRRRRHRQRRGPGRPASQSTAFFSINQRGRRRGRCAIAQPEKARDAVVRQAGREGPLGDDIPSSGCPPSAAAAGENGCADVPGRGRPGQEEYIALRHGLPINDATQSKCEVFCRGGASEQRTSERAAPAGRRRGPPGVGELSQSRPLNAQRRPKGCLRTSPKAQSRLLSSVYACNDWPLAE